MVSINSRWSLPTKRIHIFRRAVVNAYPVIRFCTVILLPFTLWISVLESGSHLTREKFQPTYGQVRQLCHVPLVLLVDHCKMFIPVACHICCCSTSVSMLAIDAQTVALVHPVDLRALSDFLLQSLLVWPGRRHRNG